MICRVFQKNTNARSSTGGGTKLVADKTSIYIETINSSPSVSLPPLLDTSYASATSAYTADHDNYFYDNNTDSKEHVPCFSNDSTNNFNSRTIFDLPQQPLSGSTFTAHPIGYQNNVGVSAFPSLRTLQENLQLPLFYSSVAPLQPPVHGDGVIYSYGNGNLMPAVSSLVEEQKVGVTELDCIWSF